MAKGKKPKPKFYAVRVGFHGPDIFTSWTKCEEQVKGCPGALYQGFQTRKEAEDFIAPFVGKPGEHVAAAAPPEHKLPIPEPVRPPAPLPPRYFTPSVKLSKTQQQVFNRVKKGQNVFFTGSAGTGKSLLMREIINHKGGRTSSRLAVTAATGIAAVNIGGITVHSWSGYSKFDKDLGGKLIGQRKKRQQTIDRWREVDTLIVDEISMMNARMFDMLEACARRLRDNDKPFGGIQLVLSGDFFQLPPVPDKQGEPIKFAFEAESWNRCLGSTIMLKEVFRQKEQPLVTMLNEARFGKLSAETIQAFRKLSRPVQYTDDIEPTRLYPTNAEVDAANRIPLRKLPEPGMTFKSSDTAGFDGNWQPLSEQAMLDSLSRNTIAPKQIELRVGAQVMLIKNLVQGVLVNGTVGHVIAFKTPIDARRERLDIAGINMSAIDLPQGARDRESFDSVKERVWPLVQFENGRELLCIPQDFTVENGDGRMEARRVQVPLIHAWALSVHKSQGQTLKRVVVDLKNTFEYGQAYVALSRATRMDQLQVLNFDPSKVRAHPRVLKWYSELELSQEEDEDEDESAPEEDEDEVPDLQFID